MATVIPSVLHARPGCLIRTTELPTFIGSSRNRRRRLLYIICCGRVNNRSGNAHGADDLDVAEINNSYKMVTRTIKLETQLPAFITDLVCKNKIFIRLRFVPNTIESLSRVLVGLF